MKRILYEAIKYCTMVAGIVLAILLILHYEHRAPVRPSDSSPLFAEENGFAEETVTEADTERESILVPHCGDVTYTLSSHKTDFSFANPAENTCLLRVSVTRRDTSETIYVSSLLSPGSSVSNVRFFRDFSTVGDYDAMVKIDAYRSEFGTLSLINSMVIDITVHAV